MARDADHDGLLALAIAAGLVLVQWPFLTLHVSLLDEGAILHIADTLRHGGVPYLDAVHYVFPGVFYAIAGAFALGGTSIETARAFVALTFAVTTAVAYLIARWFVGRRGALAVVAVFLVYRVWAYPHWQVVNYSSLAMMFLVVATWALGASLASARLTGVALSGIGAGLAMLTKQDSGAFGTAALGLGVLLLCRPVVPAALAFGGAWLVVVGGVLGALVAAGAGAELVRQAVQIPINTALYFDYPTRPPLWPLWKQDMALRQNPFSFGPPIVVDLYWGAIVASRLYRETALVDAALKLVFHLPWIVLLAGAVVCLARARRSGLRTPGAGRQALLVLVTGASVAAFSRPQDWSHCLVLYPPVILLLVSLLAPLGRSRALVALGVVTLAAALAFSANLALALRRKLDTPIRTPRGVLMATAPQASSLQPLVERLARDEPPDAPLISLPYHPLVPFLAGRPPVSRFCFLWPADPAETRDAEIIRGLSANAHAGVVFSETQAPFLPRFQAFAPALFAYLVEHYTIDEVYDGGPLGYTFFLLAHRPLPSGMSLLGGRLDGAEVSVEGRPVGEPERSRLVGAALWPFVPVLRMATLPGVPVAVAYPLVAEPAQRLETRYGIHPDHWRDVPPVRARFSIAVRDDAGEREVWSADVDPVANASGRRWALATVDLSPWAHRQVALVLRVSGPRGTPERADVAGWGEPRLVPSPAS